jgi:type 1 glutamine amidotransferase
MSESKVLILAQSDKYHPLEILGEMMSGWLKAENVDITLSKDRSALSSDLNQYNLLVFAMTAGKLSPSEEDALVSFVDSGKRLFGIHSATVVEPENVKYIDMIGGRFVHHSPHHEFTVKIADPGHPILENMSDFKITDELYVLDRTPSSASILMTAFWENHAQPMLYLKAYGRGRVLYNALGHDQNAYENPNFKKLVIRSVKWLLKH